MDTTDTSTLTLQIKFQGDIKFDNPKLIKIATLDIECECEDGFPDPTLASEKVNAITIKPFGKDTHVFGIALGNMEGLILFITTARTNQNSYSLSLLSIGELTLT